MDGFLRFVTAAKTSWVVLVLAALIAGGFFALGSGSDAETAPTAGLPDSAESVQVDELLDEFPSADTTSALLVFAVDDGELAPETLALIGEKAAGELADFTPDGFVPPAQVSDDGTVALLVVPLDPEADVDLPAERAAEIRDAAAADLDDVRVYLTGPEGFEVDVAAVFAGADFT
ncbi:MMPL family transporter, partial [Microbacterium sp.]|uniref:MMPL family transporter n=1 Tax=Microbacterium sp. TaxID=51671 RepID=UPI0035ADDCEB